MVQHVYTPSSCGGRAKKEEKGGAAARVVFVGNKHTKKVDNNKISTNLEVEARTRIVFVRAHLSPKGIM